MDDRAFDYLRGSLLEVQDVVLNDFNLQRKAEEDYSAPVTAFVRAVSLRVETKKRGRRVDMKSNFLEDFAQRYPMDDRAWDYLKNSSASVQREVVERFRPVQENERDYSRLITAFTKQCRG